MSHKETLIRLATLPCTGKVIENGVKLKCRDNWRQIVVDDRGKVLSIKCLHGHKSRGALKKLANPL